MSADYQLRGHIGTTLGGPLFHARRMNDGIPVILKRTGDNPANPGLAQVIRKEYRLLQSLDIPGVAKPIALIIESGSPSIVLKDFPGESLERLLNNNPHPDLAVCLQIAINLADALAGVHAAHITHLDVRPANVLVEPTQWQVLLADFSIAASGEPGFLSAGLAARSSNWAYMSPEQTGRMNRAIDYRTDFYSFGVTFYRMLTGRLPFSADDPLEWAHCHIARHPQPPSALSPAVPRPVSDIVMKLMAKLPEDRYQSMRGVKADLEHCLQQWRSSGRIEAFSLAEEDDPDRFQVPHKLYGRERERAALLAAFDQVAASGRPALVTLAGYAGVGKSALVGELLKPIAERRGNFISGKFDQYRRDIPYATITHAFRDLVQQLLAESEERIAAWQARIQDAVGADGQLVVDLLPQLELIIGKQSPVAALPLAQAEHRFHDVFCRFIGVFATKTQPLVLFLDDVQWIDAASLKLIEHLFADAAVGHLLLIAAYRHNEVDSNHPFLITLDTVRRHGTTHCHIRLAPLPLKHLNRIVSDALRTSAATCEPLARLVFDKTDGNPFFFIQFLVSLHEENLLWWNANDRAWRWDLDQIKARNFADNVVSLMIGKLRRLPEPAQHVLEIAACLGNKFDLRNVALVCGTSESEIRKQLSEPIQENLITCTNIGCRFLHDRIQQATYSLIPEACHGEMHLAIGRALLSGLSADEVAEQVFDVANQLNLGAALLVQHEEKIRVAELNLRAGRKARASAAPASAHKYLAAGIRLLQEDDWKTHYRLVFDLWLECANNEFLLSDFDAARSRTEILLQKGASRIDLAAAYHLKMLVHEMESEYQQGVDSALACLRLFGMNLPSHPDEEDVLQEVEAVWRNLEGRPIEHLIDLPRTSDPEMQAVMDILQTVHTCAFLTDVNLSNLLPCRILNLGMQHGVNGAFAHGCGRFGAGLGPLFHRYDEGYRFARLACQLIEKHGFLANKAKAYFAMEMTALWTQPVSTALDFVRTACRCAVEASDLPVACYSWGHILTDLRLRGDSLNSVERELEHGLEFVRKTRFRLVADGIVAQQRFIAAMRGRTGNLASFDGEQFDEAAFEAALAQGREKTLVCFYWILKLMARFMAGDHAAALAAARQAEVVLPVASGRIQMLDYVYFSALTMAALHDKAEAAERREWRALLAAQQSQLREWMENCPSTFRDKFALVSAEIARIDGQDFESVLRLYQEAIQAARESGFVHTEAIAHELAAGFRFARGFPVSGRAHLDLARHCYARWGAEGKLAQLEQQYPDLRATDHAPKAMQAFGELQLDLLSVIKATQAISGHILLDELIDTLMRIVTEHAGAQSGCLLLVRNGELMLAAEAAVNGQSLHVKQHEALVSPQEQLPAAILNYVQRSREQVLLLDASAPHPFAADPYFAVRHPKSVLCLPILRQSALVGLLYLENDLATHAFTPGHAKVLEVLACQAAISLENARLFSDLQIENIERKRTEDALREREARIRQLVESNIIGVFFFDMHGGMRDANDALLDMLGYSRNDLDAGKLKWTTLTPSASRALDAEKEAELRRTGRCTPYEKEFVRKDGRLVPVLIGAALFEDSQEQGVAFVLDISDRKKTEVEREARRAAEAANRAKSAFLASMSHELRTPLNAILGYAQILSQDRWPRQGRMSGLDVIQQSGEHLLNLINDILDLAKIEADKLELFPTDLALEQFLRALADMIAVRAEQKSVAFRCELAPDLPAGTHVDEVRLRQVLLNLLSNAVKFTDRGTVTFRVSCTPAGQVRFEVADSGIGIPVERQKALFEAFVQVGEARHRHGGTGLGLSISRKIVRLMGGDIQVESVAGQGSRFWFDLELPSVAAAALPGSASEPVGAIAGYSGPRKTILIADDIAENRAVLADMLGPLGFRLIEACNGEECLEKASSTQPDLILIDIIMPELDGLAVIRHLRQIPACRGIPIIAVSASASTDDANTCRSAGADGFIPKPVDFGKLLASIGKLLDLCWTYKLCGSQEAVPRVAVVESFGLPPASEMLVLLQLAKLGNMQEILAWADRIAAADSACQAFVTQLRGLAVTYQSKAILQFVERHAGGITAGQPGG